MFNKCSEWTECQVFSAVDDAMKPTWWASIRCGGGGCSGHGRVGEVFIYLFKSPGFFNLLILQNYSTLAMSQALWGKRWLSYRAKQKVYTYMQGAQGGRSEGDGGIIHSAGFLFKSPSSLCPALHKHATLTICTSVCSSEEQPYMCHCFGVNITWVRLQQNYF